MLADTEQAIRTTGLTFEELLERQLSSAEAQGPFTPGSYVKERFYTPRGGQTPAAPRAWEIDEVDEDQQSDDDDQFEKNVLTPVRLANQRQWNSIQQEHAERLCAFEQIERMIFETSDDGPGQQSLPKDIRHSTHETRYPSTAYPSIARRAPSMNDLTLGRINEVSLTRSRSTGDFPIKEHEVPDGLNRLIEDHENDIPSVMSNATIIAKRAQSPEGKSNIPTVVRSENKFGWNSTQGHNSGDGVSDEDSKSILRPVKLAEAQTPAPSKLLYNLFPGLRPKTEIPAQSTNTTDSANDKQRHQQSSKDSDTELANKLQELEKEFAAFRKAEVTQRRDDLSSSETARRLESDKKMFENYKIQEMEKLRIMREEAVRDIKRDKSLWERQRKAADVLPSKKERHEMEVLRKQIESLQNSAREEKSRLTLAHDRLKRRVEDLTKRNNELQEEVKVLEQQRATWLQRNSTPADIVQKPTVTKQQQPIVVKHPRPPTALPNALIPNKSDGPVVANASPPASKKRLSSKPSQDFDEEVPFTKSTSASGSSALRKTKAALMNTKIACPELDHMQEKLGLVGCIEQHDFSDGKQIRIYQHGVKLVRYQNRTIKEVHPKENVTVIHFTNGDYKKVMSDGRIVYWYSEPRTLHTTFKDGLQLYEFSSGQIEKHYPDGTNEIVFADKTVKYIYKNGEEESLFPDGRIQRVDKQGKKTLEHPSGTREIFHGGYRTKHFADGTIREVKPDGTQETRWIDGRVRIKDSQGHVLYDSRTSA